MTGRAELVPEPQIDIIASLCGSSVAWFYMMVEGASDGAVKCGLPRKLATELAARALVGAGNMIIKTGKHPGEVKSYHVICFFSASLPVQKMLGISWEINA